MLARTFICKASEALSSVCGCLCGTGMYPTIESKMRDKAAAKAAAEEGRVPTEEEQQQQQQAHEDGAGDAGGVQQPWTAPAGQVGAAAVLHVLLTQRSACS